MTKTVEYVRPLGEDVRKRHLHVQSGNRITRFAVQLELLYNNEWQPVIRYDTAHGYAHIDVYHPSGEVEKERLLLSFEQSLNLADDDIEENWARHAQRYLKEGTR